MKHSYLSLFLFMLILTGCGNNPKLINSNPVDYQPNDQATVKMAEAAKSISDSLLELAQIQAQATPPISSLPSPSAYAIGGFGSIDWAGPVQPVVSKLANMAGYRLRILGNPPAIPILIAISAENTPLSHILRDVDFQAGRRADIRVNSRSRIVELHYAKA